MKRRALSKQNTSQGASFRRRKQNGAKAVTKLNPALHPTFMLGWHPNRWDIIEGELMPVFQKFADTPGLRGIGEGGTIEKVEGVLRTMFGWNLIHEADGLEYLEEHEARGGKVYLCKWEEPVLNSTKLKNNHEVFKDFVEQLLDLGVIEMPSEEWVLGRLEDWTALYEQMVTKNHGRETGNMALLKSKIDILQSYLEDSEEEELPPEPARKRTSRKEVE